MSRKSAPPLRGQVFRVRLPSGLKPILIVSNNQRNTRLPTILAVRITSAPKPTLPSIVDIPDGEPVHGRVLCDEIAPVPVNLLRDRLGALSAPTMRRVDEGLLAALSLAQRP